MGNKMTIINCYAVTSNGEDGRGKSVLEARFKESKDAQEIFTSKLTQDERRLLGLK